MVSDQNRPRKKLLYTSGACDLKAEGNSNSHFGKRMIHHKSSKRDLNRGTVRRTSSKSVCQHSLSASSFCLV